MSAPRAIIIGFGTIGKALRAKLSEAGWHIDCIAKNGTVFDGRLAPLGRFDSQTLAGFSPLIPPSTDIAFLAIPSANDGSGFRYIETLLREKRARAVVTCEKASLAFHFSELKSLLPRIGYNATVGGGMRMLSWLEERTRGRNDAVIHAVLNGTINYLFDTISSERWRLNEAVREARRRGLCEPGSENPCDIIKAELRDVLLKTSIIFNACLSRGTYMHPAQVAVRTFDERGIDRLVKHAKHRRLIVSFAHRHHPGAENHADGFLHEIESWNICASFMDTHYLASRSWLPKKANNAIRISEGIGSRDGIYVLSGPGAGPHPTTAAMIADARHLLATFTPA